MDKEIMVTICCITYNQEDYIKDALDSFVNQKTNFRYEVIVHDDASTDNTANIIREYEKKYPDLIKPIYQKDNQYQKGIPFISKLYRKCKGKYIALCEGDDYWTDVNKLQIQVDYLEKNKDCTFLFHNAEVLDMETGETEKFVPYTDESKMNMTEDGNYDVAGIELLGFIPTASVMFRKENVAKIPDWFDRAYVGDWPLRLIMTSFGYAHFDDRIMSIYRRNAKGSATVLNQKNEKESYEKRKDILNKKNEILYNIDEFTNYKYHETFEKQIILNEIDFFANTNNKKEIIKRGYLKHFNFRKKIKIIVKSFFPKLTIFLQKYYEYKKKIR